MTGRILLLAVLVSAIMANANGAFASTPGLDRFLVIPRTITSTVTSTTTTTSLVSISTSCASLLSATAACRRRRMAYGGYPMPAMLADVQQVDPSLPQPVEATAAPEEGRAVDSSAPEAPAAADQPDTSAGVPPLLQPSIENTDGMAEVQIRNLDSVCAARAANPFFGVGLAQLFGISVVFSTTVTANATVTVTSTTVTKTNTFVISSCTPSPFPFSVCPTAG